MMNNKKKFKLRYIVVPFIGIVICVCICFSVLPGGMRLPAPFEVDYFSLQEVNTFAELFSFQTLKEKSVGNEVVERARACMEYTGDEQSAPEMDELDRYYYFPTYRRPARTHVRIKLVKCVIKGEEGSVWFDYSFACYDENDSLIQGSWDILTRCTIMKDESGDWLVTGVSEHP